MLHLLMSQSPLMVAGEIALGLCIPLFVEGLILAFGDRIRIHAGR
jgi:hypothetical protein